MAKALSYLKPLLVWGVVFCAGCGAMIADHVVAKYPTFQEVAMKWPALREGQGRVVIYFPKQGAMKSFNLFANTGGFVSLPLNIDGTATTTVGDRTFVFADLEQGKHTVVFKGLNIFNKDTTLEIDVSAGGTQYIEVTRTHMNDTPPRLVDEPQALQALALLHHNYQLPLPFPEQPRRAARAM